MSRHDHKSSDLLELPGHANSLPPKRPGLGGGSAGMVGWTAGDGLLTSKITKGGVQCFVFGSDCFETLRNNVAVTKISPENEIVWRKLNTWQ